MRFQKRSVLWFFGLGTLIVGVLILIGTMVKAQEVQVPPVALDTQSWIALVQQILLLLVTGVLIPLALKFLQDRGLSVEQKHRDALQTAVQNAAGLLLDSSLSWEQKKQRALGYVETGAGAAMDYFRADPERVFLMVLSYYNRMTEGDVLSEIDPYIDGALKAPRRRRAQRWGGEVSATRRRPPP